MKTIRDSGIEWTYRPGIFYTAEYQGFNINIRRMLARTAITGKPWRLCVSRHNGGSLAFGHQFWESIAAARAEGKRLVDDYVGKL